MNNKLRIRFEKTGRAVYVSHLDLMRTMQRAFLRAGFPLAYSEGFNPHAILSMALPLSVGMESVCELMDFRLRDPADPAVLPERLTAAMPEGIRVLEAYEPERKFAQIKWLHISGRLEYDRADPAGAARQLTALFSQEALVIVRKTKRGEGEADIRPAVREISFAPGEGQVTLQALISAQNPTLNPTHLVSAVERYLPELMPDFTVFRREALFDENMQAFR
ncbi:MAG: TIGR03936 family radical SAM-associated protein [Clostridiales bacterium]|nr:TIGR03936 family radical SAM-associated protein [Clostridiales bacterium]